VTFHNVDVTMPLGNPVTVFPSTQAKHRKKHHKRKHRR
jgi:hypothetical protein